MLPDPWHNLRRLTSARIALGRAGGSLPSEEVLRFGADHALARDAVWMELDVDALRTDLAAATDGLPIIDVTTQASDRATFLKRPDLGRRLDDASERAVTAAASPGGCDVAILVADGLSALAAQKQSPLVLAELLPMLRAGGLSLGAIVIARQARVAVQDAIGQKLGARCAVILLGERPGLGTPDSLGAYLIFDPKPGNTDANRNCVSNIRAGGLPPAAAAKTLNYLITQSLSRRISGVALKDDRSLATDEHGWTRISESS